MAPLIAADQHWPLWAILLGVAAFGLWAEGTRLGGRLSGMVVALLGTMLLANLGVIPSDAPAYDVVWAYLVPLAIPLLLVRADLRRILREAGPTLLAFGAGTVGSVLGTLAAFALVPLGDAAWQLAAVLCATYIGGSLNYVATAQAVGLRDSDLLAAGVAADNLVMALYFLVLLGLSSSRWLTGRFAARVGAAPEPRGGAAAEPAGPSLRQLAYALALAGGTCAVGFTLEGAAGVKGTAILFITAVVVAAATLSPRLAKDLCGAEVVGTYLMQVFFATIGASAHVGTVLRVGPLLFVFAAVILLVHLAVVLTAGKLLGLALPEVIIASNANIGGPTTAAAMATSQRWEALVVPAILCGTLGYAGASFIGIAVGHLLR